MLELAEKHQLMARRIHDARHAAIALTAGITQIYTYDIEDWKHFHSEGLIISGPASVLSQLILGS
jgi:predicted nucleic acid-binding protein